MVDVNEMLHSFDPKDREQDRWVSTTFAAISMIGLSGDDQKLLLFSLLHHHFSDAPSQMPSPRDTQVYAAYAVRLLLRALLDDVTPKMRMAKEEASELWFNAIRDNSTE